MKIAVWDTYVPRRSRGDGVKNIVMHFDILVAEATSFDRVQSFGQEYLAEKGEGGQPLTTSECSFCHIETATEAVERDIAARGYSIIEMEGCTIPPQTYTPIDCGFHDRLEAIAVTRSDCHVEYLQPDGRKRAVTTKITDLLSRDGEEFAELESAGLVRLDHLISVDGNSRP